MDMRGISKNLLCALDYVNQDPPNVKLALGALTLCVETLAIEHFRKPVKVVIAIPREEPDVSNA